MRSLFTALSLIAIPACTADLDDTVDTDVRTGTFDTALGRITVAYQDIDGDAVYQGDIVVGRAGDIALDSATRTNRDFRWPGGVVPYAISSSFSSSQRAEVVAAIAAWNNSTPYRMIARTDQSDFVQFKPGTGSACTSPIGRQGGSQSITLPSGCYAQQITHEIGHAVGLWHEQSRSDRDTYLNVNWANIQPQYQSQFYTYVEMGADGENDFNFDFSSIMLYPPNIASWAVDPSKPVMTRKSNGSTWTPGTTLSDEDISGATRFLTYTPYSTTVFNIVNVNSGKCLALQSPSQSRNTGLTQQSCDYFDLSQRWYFYANANLQSVLINALSGDCIDTPNAATGPTWLQQFPCHLKANQIIGIANPTVSGNPALTTGEIEMLNSGECLDVENASAAAGAHVNQFPCSNHTNQRWTFHPVITD